MASAFDASWEEQLWRIRVEQEVFSCQRADVYTLRNELKHLSQVCNDAIVSRKCLVLHNSNLHSFNVCTTCPEMKLSYVNHR